MENNKKIPEITKYYKYPFAMNDIIVNYMYNNEEFRHEVMILREYKIKDIDRLVLMILPEIQKIRKGLEEKEISFQNKKIYLKENINNSKIQISLENEYFIKTCIEKYKIYEFINWFHLNRNDKIVEYCGEKKKDILNSLYPIIYLPICKVIGSKVVSPTNYDVFEDVVNMVWINIIKYLPKINTSKPMFSVIVATAEHSAKHFRSTYKENNYWYIKMTDLETILNIGDEEDISDSFIDGIINQLATNSCNIDDLYITPEDIDDMIDNVDRNNDVGHIKKCVESYSYSVLTYTKQNNILSLFRIFAVFFIELINNNISPSVIHKHSSAILDIFDFNIQANNIIMDERKLKESNKNLYKFLKDYIKSKIQIKLTNNGLQKNLSVSKIKQHYDIVEEELDMLHLLQENQPRLLTELIKYRNYSNSGADMYD